MVADISLDPAQPSREDPVDAPGRRCPQAVLNRISDAGSGQKFLDAGIVFPAVEVAQEQARLRHSQKQPRHSLQLRLTIRLPIQVRDQNLKIEFLIAQLDPNDIAFQAPLRTSQRDPLPMDYR